MKKPNLTPRILIFAAVVVLGGFSIFGQGSSAAPDQSFEATLHVLIGSDDAAQRSELPRSLEGVSKQIRDNFTFKNYRVMNTYFGRLVNDGSLDYKSVSSVKTGATDSESPTFVDWQLSRFKAEPPTSGSKALSMQSFRFGARVPVVVAKFSGPEAAGSPIVNYENVGLTLTKLSISENSPTLIGTISLPKTTGTVFLVMTIRPV